jgi:radical SAM protein with 4Fe4S-binding SPASM domain
MNISGPVDTILRHGRFYLRHHTPARLANLGATMGALLQRPIHTPNMPISLKIEPSAMCQLACPGCAQSNPLFKMQTRGKLMSRQVFERILSEAGRYLYRIQFYDYGEPFTNKHLLEMISLASSLNIGSQVSTNFSFNFPANFYREVIEARLEHLIVAMDGVTHSTYSQYRIHGRYELVESALRKIIESKRRLRSRFPFVEWQFIVFDHNRHEIEAAKSLAAKIGVDRLCLKYDGGSVPTSWHRKDRIKYKLSHQLKLNTCLWLWGSLVIDAEGRIRPCCNAGHSEVIGDLNTTPLRDIWNSDAIKDLRKCVRAGGTLGEPNTARIPCHGCPHII